MSKLWDSVKSLVVLAAIVWVAWYAYSQWDSTPSVASDDTQVATFNCGRALAELANDYACRDSDTCSLSSDELRDLKPREADIERFCD